MDSTIHPLNNWDLVSVVRKTLEQFSNDCNYVIAIATLSDWLKRLAPVFQPMRSKTETKTNRTMYA